jgi:hypothetical protein
MFKFCTGILTFRQIMTHKMDLQDFSTLFDNRKYLRYQKITFRIETRYSRTLVLLPRLSPIGKIVHLIGDKFKPFFLDKLGNSRISEVIN